MGRTKKGNKSGLGSTLIKDRFSKTRNKTKSESWLHTSELDDGYEWGRLNLNSVTEQSNLDDFLATAELAGTEFTAEKLNVKVLSPEISGLPTIEEMKQIKNIQQENRKLLKIPRRPSWDRLTTPEELKQKENDSFLEWRRELALLQEKEGIVLTPFEKNLDFWRQLWRVIERSDVIVQIVDARNPLLFRCEDLERYVKEVDDSKKNLILVNKADLLTEEQRRLWMKYFKENNIDVVFWSAIKETESLKLGKGSVDNMEEEKEIDDYSSDKDDEEGDDSAYGAAAAASLHQHQMRSESMDGGGKVTDLKGVKNNGAHLMNGEELLAVFRSLHPGQDGVTTVGLVGYPNVGKSSSINALLQMKKVPVSCTPGRTKHFQTLFVDRDLCLCDCPGLVMPSFITTKAEMILNGILPIDQMRDYVPPIALICEQIPRETLEKLYGINIVSPKEGEAPNRVPTTHELVNAYGYMRGFMTTKGIPDGPRSARFILKDYVNGKLLYSYPPPGMDPELWQVDNIQSSLRGCTRKPAANPNVVTSEGVVIKKQNGGKNQVDASFFSDKHSRAHIKEGGGPGIRIEEGSSASISGKPWKKHFKQNKKEKLRRIYKHFES